jgi:hypothetical protein
MLFAYLFNLAGYNVFFQYSIRKADERIIQQLDKNQYSENQLVEVKIRLNLPYLSDWGAYERFDGEIEFQGVHYNYVKRKVSQDTLYILCLPSQDKTELYKEKNNYLISVNDIASGKENSNSTAKKNISLNEYKYEAMLYDFAIKAIPAIPGDHSSLCFIPLFFMDAPGEPPEINS